MLVQLRERKVLRRKLDRNLERLVDCSIHQPIASSASHVRLSEDVMVMAQAIAKEWGLKTPRDAVEAVFRKYANEYMYGRQSSGKSSDFSRDFMTSVGASSEPIGLPKINHAEHEVQCEAMNELDGLLGL